MSAKPQTHDLDTICLLFINQIFSKLIILVRLVHTCPGHITHWPIDDATTMLHKTAQRFTALAPYCSSLSSAGGLIGVPRSWTLLPVKGRGLGLATVDENSRI